MAIKDMLKGSVGNIFKEVALAECFIIRPLSYGLPENMVAEEGT